MADEVRLRHRIKLFVTMLTTYGYALMGAALIDPVLKHTAMEWWNFAAEVVTSRARRGALSCAHGRER